MQYDSLLIRCKWLFVHELVDEYYYITCIGFYGDWREQAILVDTMNARIPGECKQALELLVQ